MGKLFLFVIIAIIIAIVIRNTAMHSMRKAKEKVQKFAGSLRLTVLEIHPGNMRLAGEHRGRKLFIRNIAHRTKNSVHYTWMASMDSDRIGARQEQVKIVNQGPSGGFFRLIERALTLNKVKFDDPQFDRSCIVVSYDKRKAKELIDRGVMRHVLKHGKGKTFLSDGQVHFEGKGKAQDNDEPVRGAINYLWELENILSGGQAVKVPEKPDYQGKRLHPVGVKREIPQKPEVVERKSHLGSSVARPESVMDERTIPQKPEPMKESESHEVEMIFFDDEVDPK